LISPDLGARRRNILQPAPAAAPALRATTDVTFFLGRPGETLLIPGYARPLRLTWRAMLTALFVVACYCFSPPSHAKPLLEHPRHESNDFQRITRNKCAHPSRPHTNISDTQQQLLTTTL